MCDTNRRHFIAGSLTALGVFATMKTTHSAAAQDVATGGKKWACPPCGCPDDGKEFAAPGKCPSCDMELIEKTAGKPAPQNGV